MIEYFNEKGLDYEEDLKISWDTYNESKIANKMQKKVITLEEWHENFKKNMRHKKRLRRFQDDTN